MVFRPMASTPPHHRPGGGYQNPWPGSEPHGFRDFLRWRLRERPAVARSPTPPRDSLPLRRPSFRTPRAATGERTVTWVGHSTVLLQLGTLNVLTDPVWSERASPLQWIGPRRIMAPGVPFDELPAIDVVLLSHNHYDHLDVASVRRLVRRFPDAAWCCPLGLREMLRRLGARRVCERDWWQPVETPGWSATCIPAQHFSARGLRDRNETLWCGWTLNADGGCVCFAGDTGLHPDFAAVAARLGPFDLVLLPIGAYEPRWFMRSVHMNPEDAIAAYRMLAAGGGTPPCLAVHWGTFRLTDESVEEPPVRFTAAWRGAGLPADAAWVLAHGETRRF
jgi:N-acyl-phosphatidylethanolamine-hydrolysing phospholipase D